MQTLLDTNCLLRYLLEDIPEQASLVAKTIQEGACTSPEFIAECVYVLTGSVYEFSQKDTTEALLALLEDIDCDHIASIKKALEIFRESNLDFADCILAARHQIEEIPVLTFDRKLLNYISANNL